MWVLAFFFPLPQMLSAVQPLCQRGYESRWSGENWAGRKVALNTALPKKRHSLVLPATWEVIWLKTPQQQKKGVYSWWVPWSSSSGGGTRACADTAKSQELGQGGGLRAAIFDGAIQLFKCLSKKHLRCLRGLELRMAQIWEDSCIKGAEEASWHHLLDLLVDSGWHSLRKMNHMRISLCV